MQNWILFNLHLGKQIGCQLGYESREMAELCAKNYSTKHENWYAEIGVFQLVSKAKYAPQGDLQRLDDASTDEALADA